MFLHSLSIPALGIWLEIKTGKKVDCRQYVYEYHTVFDIIRYIYDVIIRLSMVLVTLAVGEIWSGKKVTSTQRVTEEPNSYTEYLEDMSMTSKDHSAMQNDYKQKGENVERLLISGVVFTSLDHVFHRFLIGV
jgi:hypothetical protein